MRANVDQRLYLIKVYGKRLQAPAAMGFSAAPPAKVDNHGHQEVNQVDALQGMVGVHQPGIDQGGQRQEEEAQDGDDEVLVGTLQVSGREVHHDEHDPGKSQDQKHEQARHERSPLRLSQKS